MAKILCILTILVLITTGCSADLETDAAQDPSGFQKKPNDNQMGIIDANGYISDGRTNGSNEGYYWTIYKQGGWGKITFPYAHLYSGNFEIEYQNNLDIVGGKGWSVGTGRTVNYNIGLLQGAYDFVGVYGWTRTPLVEYYVVEKGNIPGENQNQDYVVNGKTYQFKKQLRQNAPSILGTKTFYQYISQHGNAPTGNNQQVNMQSHINHWNDHGGHRQEWGNLRNFDYQLFGIESYSFTWGKINASVW